MFRQRVAAEKSGDGQDSPLPKWRAGWILLLASAATFLFWLRVAWTEWQRHWAWPDGWSDGVLFLAYIMMPYFTAWGLHFAFRRSVVYDVGIYGIAICGVLAYWVNADTILNTRQGGIIVGVVPFLQMVALGVLALVCGIGRFMGKNESPPGSGADDGGADVEK